jgi:hypothetical protein
MQVPLLVENHLRTGGTENEDTAINQSSSWITIIIILSDKKALAMRLDANLSWELWPEITRAAVYLYNRTPNYINNWRTPYEIFFTRTAFRNGIVTSASRPAALFSAGCARLDSII